MGTPRGLVLVLVALSAPRAGGLEEATSIPPFLLEPHVESPEPVPDGLGQVPPAQSESQPATKLPAPRDLRALSVSPKSILLAWTFPWAELGQLRGQDVVFRINYTHQGHHDEKALTFRPRRFESDQENELSGLQSQSDYQIWVLAIVNGTETPKSESITITTDVDQPGQPAITNLTYLVDSGSLYLEWQPPEPWNQSIDHYKIFYRASDMAVFSHVKVPVVSGPTRQNHKLTDLTAMKEYVVKICAATLSHINPNQTWLGEASEEKRVSLNAGLSPSQCRAGREACAMGIGSILGVVVVVSFLFLACVGFVLWKRHLKSAYYEIDDETPKLVAPMGEPHWEQELGPCGSSPGSIAVDALEKHVTELHADSDFGFAREYEEIQSYSAHEIQQSHNHCSHVDNKGKNRYLNIVAYDHSRVILSPSSGQKKTADYINANYIDGYRKYNAYIGTQGPLEETCEAFWRMVWEQNVYVIVMITNLSERGRRKCDRYWPKDDAGITYGPFQVDLESEKVMASYTLRALKLRHLKDSVDKPLGSGGGGTLRKKKCVSGERDVLQFHYTSWPDHNVPEHTLPVLSFIKKSSEANPPDGGPIIVHCSAGVGRTGTYIAIHALLEQIRDQGEFNAFGFLKHIRQQRNLLVQTEGQYMFIHDAVIESLRSGQTEVSSKDFSSYIEELVEGESESKLDKQFELVTKFEALDFNYMSAQKPCNAMKNRDPDILPIEGSRVLLSPKPTLEGSDYINASWLHGYHRLREFVITQHPTLETKDEFWRMLWDLNAQTIVLLSPMENQDEYPIFWPTLDEEIDLETFRVHFTEKATHEGHSTLDFLLSSCQDDYELTVRVIICSGWPHNVKNLSEAFEVLHLVQAWHLEYQNGPMIVLDAFGGTEAATFCALTTYCKQLETEDAIDVYQVAKLYHDKRPGIWKSKANLLFMYKAMEALIASSHISNPVSSNVVNSPPRPVALQSSPVLANPPSESDKILPSTMTAENTGNGDLNGTTRHLRTHSDSLANGSVKMTTVGGSESSESSSRRHSLPTIHDVEAGLCCPVSMQSNGLIVNMANKVEAEEDEDEEEECSSETAALTASV